MKKITTPLAVLLLIFTTTIISCKKQTTVLDYDHTQMQMYYLGEMRNYYAVLDSFRLLPDSGYSILHGYQANTINVLTMRLAQGFNTGTYKMNFPTDTGSYFKVYKGYVTYTTQYQGGWGQATITKFDTSTRWVKGVFNGTVVNTVSPHDSFSVTDGMFEIQYHY